jgi:hypothetical protein
MIYPAALLYNISQGHYLPCKIALFRAESFCHDKANIYENSYESLQIFHNKTIKSYLFLNQGQGNYW